MQLTHGVRRAARLNRNGLASSYGSVRHSWSQLCDRIARIAGGLVARGLRPGDRVAILSPNSDHYLEAMYAVPWAGGIVVPLNTRLARRELDDQIADSGARMLLADAAVLAEARTLASSRDGIVLVALGLAPDATAGPNWNALAETSTACDDAGRGGADIAGIFYTGGTTGRAKGVATSHANLLHNVLNLLPHFRFDEQTRCLHASPMFHSADSLSIYGVTLGCGQHYYVPKFDAAAVLAGIAAERITYLALVPTMLKLMLEAPQFTASDLSSLQRIFYGGSPMPEVVMRRALAAMPHVRFHQGYGLTETSPTISHLAPKHHAFDGVRAGKAGSVGQPVFTADVAILDENGAPRPAGELGEICIKGPTVMRCYWGNPEATAAAFFGGWFRTGDIGQLDEDGFLYVVDRAKDMIISGGENVYSAEVENVLLDHASVLECAVIGVPDARWGERVHAVLRLRPGHSVQEAELLEHCRRSLARYKCPRSFEIRADGLPVSGAGKVLKAELKKRFPSA